MEFKQQVVSLELAKKLQELGFEQDSYFYYYGILTSSAECKSATPNFELHQGNYNEEREYRYHSLDDRISAYTVAELGNVLYEIFEVKGYYLLYQAYGEVFDFKGTQRIGEIGIINLMRSPDMAAKMLIYLKEHNLI